MPIDRAAVPFVLGASAPGIGGLLLGSWPIAAAGLLLALGLLAFFRDPDRRAPADAGADAVLAPADGRVVHAGEADAAVAPAGEWRQVSIFLSLLDVHVNRTPVGGRVTAVTRRAGRFRPAFARDAAADNARTEIHLDHAGQTVVVRQVVGILARRIICRIAPGMEVARGQRFGIMLFGSRMDLFVPRSAVLAVAVGQTVRGGSTVLARLAAGREAAA